MHVAITRSSYVKLSRTAQQRVAKAADQGLCVACLQPLDGRVIRGVHERCYRATRNAVLRGDFTEEDRIKEGKLLECQPGGRKVSNIVTKEALGIK